jgi:hypothetical protein
LLCEGEKEAPTENVKVYLKIKIQCMEAVKEALHQHEETPVIVLPTTPVTKDSLLATGWELNEYDTGFIRDGIEIIPLVETNGFILEVLLTKMQEAHRGRHKRLETPDIKSLENHITSHKSINA